MMVVLDDEVVDEIDIALLNIILADEYEANDEMVQIDMEIGIETDIDDEVVEPDEMQQIVMVELEYNHQ